MQKQRNRKWSEQGITLIALVITVIILIILAGVSITMLVRDNGIITQAQIAKEETEIKGDEETIRLVINAIQIENNGARIEKDDLEIALLENGIQSIVVDKEDGTRNIIFLDSKKIYKLNSDGSIEDTNSDFDSIYVAPDSQDEARNEGVIGIGTDGKPVDMDLWLYSLDTVTDGYGLNSSEVFQNSEYNSNGTNVATIRTAGYNGTETNGKDIIIPQYISMDAGKTYTPVTSLYRTFNDNANIETMPTIPSTVTNMCNTFENCINLKECNIPDLVDNINWCWAGTGITKISEIPNSVIYMYGTFARCNSLIEIDLRIPKNAVTLQMTFYDCKNLKKVNLTGGEKIDNMSQTFTLCENLLEISNIPPNIQNMHQTFFKCSKLTNLDNLVIPKSVNDLTETFSECTDLAGTLIINASITEVSQYAGIFNLAVRANKILKIRGKSNIINDIIAYTNNKNVVKE